MITTMSKIVPISHLPCRPRMESLPLNGSNREARAPHKNQLRLWQLNTHRPLGFHPYKPLQARYRTHCNGRGVRGPNGGSRVTTVICAVPGGMFLDVLLFALGCTTPGTCLRHRQRG